MFDPQRTARVAIQDFVAQHGYASYMQKAKEAGVHSLRDMDDDDALRLCKALGFGAMYASAKANGTTPKAKKTTTQGMADIAREVYGDDAQDDADAGDVEINTHPPQGDQPNNAVDPAKVYENYNRLSPTVRAMRANKLSDPNDA